MPFSKEEQEKKIEKLMWQIYLNISFIFFNSCGP